MATITTIDTDQARTFLNALGPDLKWRLIKVDDQRFLKGDPGHWLENPRDTGRLVADLPLARLDDQYSWHVRPMPKEGPFVLTMLDDATKDMLDRMTAEGLPPTAAIETSADRFQVWHRWPWTMDRAHTARLLTHLQQHYAADKGANLPGHTGRLAGTRNWKRQPEKQINRGGDAVNLVMTSPVLTHDQAIDWLQRYPVPRPEPRPITIPAGTTAQFDFDDPRYQAMIARQVPMLPVAWEQAYARTHDASQADMTVAIRAVSLQLDDGTVGGILDPLVKQDNRKVHGADYIPRTIAKARQWTDVHAPGVWGPRFEVGRQFPWLAEHSRVAER